MHSYISVLTLAATGLAATISIDVGKGGALMYSPNSFTAAMGDTLEFHFYSFHSVVESAFSTPCQPLSDAFYSGNVAGNASGSKTFVYTVDSTDPIWFYCSVADHCNEGMVGVVNPPAGQSVSDYAMAAQNAMISMPAAIAGGVVTTIVAGAQSSASSTTAAPETSSTMMTTSSSSAAAAADSTTTSMSEMSMASSTSESSMSMSMSSSEMSATMMASSSTPTASVTAVASTSSMAMPSPTIGAGSGSARNAGAAVGVALFAGALVALMA